MRALWIVRSSAILFLLLCSVPTWANPFLDFFAQQKMGQEITLTGGFRRFSYKRQFFQRDHKTGKVEYFTYFGTTIIPTQIIGNGSLSLQANPLDMIVLLYPDQDLVEDLPERGNNIWFTGTLIGFQYGVSGITDALGIGGPPYILLKRVSTWPPDTGARPPN